MLISPHSSSLVTTTGILLILLLFPTDDATTLAHAFIALDFLKCSLLCADHFLPFFFLTVSLATSSVASPLLFQTLVPLCLLFAVATASFSPSSLSRT